ncbi:MAG TPA: response regulator [Tepidisphaeraceae bacterium]|jgi:PAS domain S-box-containing protein|nr:response regulator [Tepidisphaeraceae bacterium]
MLEDSSLDAELIQSRCAAGGVHADFLRVETRDDFLRAVDGECYDLILADYSLPTFDGLSALAIARQRCPDVPFIFVSGGLGEEIAIEALQSGATDYVLKQRLGRLVPAIRRALSEAHERSARRRAEEGLKIAAETARLGFWQLDIASRDLECSDEYKACFGLAPHQSVTGRDLAAMVHPDDRDDARKAYEDAIRTRSDYISEHRVVWRDGSIHWLSSRGKPLYSSKGIPIRIVGVSVDITDRKRGDLELNQAKIAAESASRAKDHFLAVLSHELRTPLSPILTTIHLMELDESLPPAMREHIDIIRRNVELEARLIDDLLDLTRIARGKIQLHSAVVDLHRLVADTIEICAADIRGKRQEILLELHAEQTSVSGDSARLQQVLWNLVKNAVKFTPVGGKIGLRTSNVNGQLEIQVRDSGIGIEASEMTRIFNAFEQADQRVTRQYGGLGLGLSIAKALVEMHNGSLACESEGAGRGSTFKVLLPIVPAADPPRKTLPALSEKAGLRILLVEDHADTARAMSSLLKMRGHKVEHATSVNSALGLADKQRFDLLISDIGLPDGSGMDVVRQKTMQNVPSIALTGYGSDEDVARCRAAGFDHHLTKPVSFDKLEAAIKQLAKHPSPENCA